MPVNSTHPAYDANKCRWDLVESVIDNNAKHWIRTVDSSDARRSEQYKKDAILTNFTRLTQIGLAGLVFRKPPEVLLPSALDYLNYDATGQNFGIEQLAHKVVMELLAAGRYGLLVDYTAGTAYIHAYKASAILDWRCQRYGSRYKANRIVLEENIQIEDPSDEFNTIEEVQYRVLRLTDDEVYYQELYNKDLVKINSIPVSDHNGRVFREIPFVFVGSENNDPDVDNIPLYDLAVLNIGHYRNSADFEESVFVAGQPMVHIDIGETNVDEFNSHYPEGIKFGSRKAVTTSGGSVSLVQASPNQIVDVAMKRKEEQAAAIGARLIAPPGGRETAEAARIRFASQNSALYTLTKNVNLAFELCLYWISLFMQEVPEESIFELNDEFYEDTADPNLIAQQIMLLDRGAMSVNEIRTNLERNGIDLEENPDLKVAEDPYVTPEE